MMFGMLQILFLISFVSIASGSKIHICNGEELSASNETELEMLYSMVNKTRCTHVIGDILISNLNEVQLPVEIYTRIRKIAGSILILNNSNILTPIEFPALRSINASLLPAITVLQNKNVLFFVGSYFKEAITNNQHRIKYAVLLNKNYVLNTAQYNIWYLAGYPNSHFLTDSSLMVKVCGENLFKPIAGILGFLFVALTIGFFTVAFYDRKKTM